MRIFHLVVPEVWAVGKASGRYAPPSLRAEGFVHFSFAGQVVGSAARHFADASELLALEVHLDPGDPALRVEDSYGTGTAYPHLYAPLAVSDVVAVHRLTRTEPDGWTFSPGDAAAPASPDR